jgi:hypothetical protein
VRAVSYPPQPGYNPYGQQPPGYGPPMGYGGQYGPQYGQPRPSTAMAYVVAALFLLCGGFALLTAITWDAGEADLNAAMVGIAFTEDLTGNIDFAVAASFTVACSTLCFALVAFARLEFVRWILGFIGGLTALYYGYAVIWLLSHDAEKVVLLPILAFVLWLAATVLVLLPMTARAMRGYQNKLARGPY